MRQHAAQLVLLVSMTSVVEACRADALFLQWPAVGPDELLFLVVEMSDGAPTIRGPYVGSEQVLPPERLALEDEAALWTVVLDHAQLGRLSPALDYGRLTEVTIERGAESCLQGRVLADFERHPVGVDHARVQVLEDQAWIDAVLPEGWAVSIPILQENCWRSPAPTLRPFGSEAWLFGPEVQVGSVALSADPSFGEFEEVLVLDESRILAASGFGVHLLERGAPWSNAPARSFFGESFPRDEGEDTVWIDDIELDPTPREEGRRLLLAYPRQGDTTRSVIATMHWNDLTGFGASEVVYEGEENLARMTQDRFGRWFAIGERGVVVWGLFDNREAERQQIPRSGDLRGLLMTEQPFEPHLAIDGTRNLFFGNVTAGTWRAETSMSIVGGLGGAAVRPSAEGVEVYFSPLGSSILLRTVEGTQESFLLRVPEDVPDCIGPSDGCGRPLPGSRIVDIALAPSGSMVFSLERCGALIEVDLDRGCTRSIVAPDMTPEDRQRMRIRSAQMEGQRLFVIGYEGLVLEAQWPQ